MKIRRYRAEDTVALVELFRQTVHAVCAQDYSTEQLAVWAPANPDVGKWRGRFSESFTLVAETEGDPAGFASLTNDGCIDLFYVAAALQSRGVGRRLFSALEKEAVARGLVRLYSDVSLTARPFFRARGFVVEKEYVKKLGPVTFPNAIMAKILT